MHIHVYSLTYMLTFICPPTHTYKHNNAPPTPTPHVLQVRTHTHNAPPTHTHTLTMPPTHTTHVLQVRTHTKRESVMHNIHNKTDYPFDYFFEHTNAKNTPLSEEQEVASDDSVTDDDKTLD